MDRPVDPAARNQADAFRPRQAVRMEPLEPRLLLAVGGGLLDAGITGEYFDNPDLAGEPVFTRNDIRLDFDWGEHLQPGGGLDGSLLESVPADDYSIRWEGRLSPRFTETYTFSAYADSVRMWIKADAEPDYSPAPQIDHWPVDEPTAYDARTFDYAMTAGEVYDVRIEYRERTGSAMMRLLWESPSTPQEVVSPAAYVGEQPPGRRILAADAMWGATNWGDKDGLDDGDLARDADGNPIEDFAFLIRPQDQDLNPGTYLMQFKGTAEVYVHLVNGERFASADGSIDYGDRLDPGEGYDAGTNTTAVRMILPPGSDNCWPNFIDTDRDGPGTDFGLNSGVADLKLMRPATLNGQTPHELDEVFARDAVDAMDRFVTYRWNDVNGAGDAEWTDRKNLQGLGGDTNENHEYKILWCNRTGRDLWIQVPHRATDDYVTQMARLLRHGSDADGNPYTAPQADPVHPPLNPNLRIHVEYSNEAPWNGAGQYPQARWMDNEVENLRQAWLADPDSPDGRRFALLNYDGALGTDGDLSGSFTGAKRFFALRTKEISDIFRSVFGDQAMPAPGRDDPRVRPVLMYQYDNYNNTARDALLFLDDYFNRTDPASTHTGDAHPVSYYLYGAGAATYYASADRLGIAEEHPFNLDEIGSFQAEPVPQGQAVLAPGDSPWTFTGTGGVYHQPSREAPGLAAMGTPTTEVDDYTYRGFKFTVGPDDVAVYELGRYVEPGNTDVHWIEIRDAQTHEKVGGVEIDLADFAEGSVAHVRAGKEIWIASRKFWSAPYILQAHKSYYLVCSENPGADAHYTDVELTAPAGIVIDGTVKGSNDGGTWDWIEGTTPNRAFGPVSMKIAVDPVATADEGFTLGFAQDSKEDRDAQMRSNDPADYSTQAMFLAGTASAAIEVTFDAPGTYGLVYHVAYKRDQQPYLDTDGDGDPDDENLRNRFQVYLDDGTTAIDISPGGQSDVRPGNWSYEGYWTKPSIGFDFFGSAPFEITDTSRTYTLRFETSEDDDNHAVLIDNVNLASTASMLAGEIPYGGGLAEGQPDVTEWEARVMSQYVYGQSFGLKAMAYEGGWYPGGDANKMPLQFASAYYDPQMVDGERNAQEILARAGLEVATDYTRSFACPDWDLAHADDYRRMQAWDQVHGALRTEADNGLPVSSTFDAGNAWWDKGGEDGSLAAGQWLSWNVIVPETGLYVFRVEASAGGELELCVDEASTILSGATGEAIENADGVFLTKGLHALRLKAVSGGFDLSGVFGAAMGEPFGTSGLVGEPGNGKAVLRWDYHARRAEGFHVYYRRWDQDDWTRANDEPVTAQGYTVDGLASGEPYDFMVRTIVPDRGLSALSNTIRLTPDVEAPMTPLLHAIAVDHDAGEVTLDWRPPDEAIPTMDPDSYTLRYTTAPGADYTEITGILESRYVLTGIDTSIPLHVSVEAVNSLGSARSAEISVLDYREDLAGVPVGQVPSGWSADLDPNRLDTIPQVAEPSLPEHMVSPTGTPLLNTSGWGRDVKLTYDLSADMQYYTVQAVLAHGRTNNFDANGVTMFFTDETSYLRVYVNSNDDLWLHCKNGDQYGWKKSMRIVADDGEEAESRVMDHGEFWTLIVAAAPGEQVGTMDLSMQLYDQDGVGRLSGDGPGEFVGDTWVYHNVPAPLLGLRGAFGSFTSITSGSDDGPDGNYGNWHDSLAIRPTVIPVNQAPEFTSTPDRYVVAGEFYTYDVSTIDAEGNDVSLDDARIPDWLTLTDHGDGSATLSGTPDADDAGDWTVALRASDGAAWRDQFYLLHAVATPDTAPPRVERTETIGPVGGLQGLVLGISEDVGDSIDIGDLAIVNESAGGTPVDLAGASLAFSPWTYDATIDLAGALSEPGFYTVALSAGGVSDLAGNALDGDADGSGGDDHTGGVYQAVGGDAGLDGRVDVTDLAVLAANWNAPDASWSQGEFTGDGLVDVSDLAVLAARWGTDLTPAEKGRMGVLSSVEVATIAEDPAAVLTPVEAGQATFSPAPADAAAPIAGPAARPVRARSGGSMDALGEALPTGGDAVDTWFKASGAAPATSSSPLLAGVSAAAWRYTTDGPGSPPAEQIEDILGEAYLPVLLIV